MSAPTPATTSRAAHRACWLLACALAMLPSRSPLAADCVVLDYRLPEASTPEAQEVIARGLVAHLDWLRGNGVRFVNDGVDSGNIPAVCLSFTGPSWLIEAMVDPILAAWAAPAQRHSTSPLPADLPAPGQLPETPAGRIVLSPAAGLGELVDALAVQGLQARRHPRWPGSEE